MKARDYMAFGRVEAELELLCEQFLESVVVPEFDSLLRILL